MELSHLGQDKPAETGRHSTGYPVVAMIGAGQLARMTHQAAISLGQSVRVLAGAADEAAALVASDVHLGDYTDVATVREFVKGADAVTFDHEHVPAAVLEALAAEGVALYPPPSALVFAQDKLAMRAKVAELGLPNPQWAGIDSGDAARTFAEQHGGAIVLKAAKGGYDGKGVWLVDSPGAAAAQALTLLDKGVPVLAEERVALASEVAAVVARSPYGQVAAWPIVETVQRDGICVEVIAPAPGLSEDQAVAAQHIAITLATELGVVGVLAVEMFVTTGGELLINELAMRPHNSGHWSMDGATTDQFEQHLRAVLDYPLGATTMRAPVVVMANVLGGPDGGASMDERIHHLFAADPAIKVHMYGKQLRPGRKLGHVTAWGSDVAEVRARATAAAEYLRTGTRPTA